jgi:glycerol dehydrogenase
MKTIIFPGQYTQGPDLINKIPEVMSGFGEKPMILTDPLFLERVQTIMESSNNAVIEEFTGECCYKEINRINEIAKMNNISVIAGVGGGKTLDCAKVVADRLEIPVVIVPTLASTDAPCTGVAVIYTEDGIVADFLIMKRSPASVLVDTKIIMQAPIRFLVAGMGDALATGFEARSVEQSGAKAYYDGQPTETGFAIARLASEIVLKYGKQAKEDCIKGELTPAVEKIIEANILLSGVGCLATNIATAHSIHNGLTQLPETKPYQHGEKVAFGILVGLHLNNAKQEELEKIYEFCHLIGLPTTFEAIGLENVSREQLLVVVDDVCGEESFIFNEPVDITRENVLKALYSADEMGRSSIKGLDYKFQESNSVSAN